jgi:hypothetical protein
MKSLNLNKIFAAAGIWMLMASLFSVTFGDPLDANLLLGHAVSGVIFGAVMQFLPSKKDL